MSALQDERSASHTTAVTMWVEPCSDTVDVVWRSHKARVKPTRDHLAIHGWDERSALRRNPGLAISEA